MSGNASLPLGPISPEAAMGDELPSDAQVHSTGLIVSEPVVVGLSSATKVAGSHFDMDTPLAVTLAEALCGFGVTRATAIATAGETLSKATDDAGVTLVSAMASP